MGTRWGGYRRVLEAKVRGDSRKHAGAVGSLTTAIPCSQEIVKRRSYVDENAYFAAVAAQLCAEVAQNTAIRKFADNSDVIGAYAENTVRKLIDRIVSPFRVSTGAVVAPELCEKPEEAVQMDVIVWNPCPLPALFEAGSFGLLPKRSVLATMEIKRTDYDDGLNDIKRRAACADALVDIALPEGTEDPVTFLGVVCIRENLSANGPNKLTNLVDDDKAVWLINRDRKTGDCTVNERGVLSLVNFLARVRRQGTLSQGVVTLNRPEVAFGY
ncbi:DUF6602 domain-containing protein [Planctomycetota bacterium]